MSRNNLIIGLGGTGGKIIRSLRKAIYQEYRANRPGNVNIDYLYIDSSNELMDPNDTTWKVLGHNVPLHPRNQIKITGTDLNTILDNINNYPGIKPWIGDRNQWRDILNSIVGETLGGQKRRLGRFLFANHIFQFKEQLETIIRKMQEDSGLTGATFHVCCGLAGGTGSGTVIDIITQIRDMGYVVSDGYKIILYTLLPDANPPRNWDTGNYHANGYAALLELNSLSVGSFKPCDLKGDKDLLKVNDPFNGCYIFNNENENGLVVNVDNELPDILADFLLKKITAKTDFSGFDSLSRMENAENGDGTPEKAPGNGKPARSKRFLSFGIKRLAVPEEEILEYMTYSFSRQVTLQLLYNNWEDGIGFQDSAKQTNMSRFIKEEGKIINWRLTDDHICLSFGILDDDINKEKWKIIDDEWQDSINQSARAIKDDAAQKRKILDELEKACRNRFEEGYRDFGVKRFYELKSTGKAKKEMAMQICKQIEIDLLDYWKNATKSILEISEMLSQFIMEINERKIRINKNISKNENEITSLTKEIDKNKNQWNKVGIVGTTFGKHNKIIDAHTMLLTRYYIQETWREAWVFGKKLLEEIKIELINLKNEVDACISKLKEMDTTFKKNLDERCRDDEPNLKSHLVRYYNPEFVRKTTDAFLKDNITQITQTGYVRSFLIDELQNNQRFNNLNKVLSKEGLIDMLTQRCEEKVKDVHEKLIHNPSDKLLDISIVERLKNQYNGDIHGLSIFIRKLVESAGKYIKFSDSEKNKKGEGISGSPTCLSSFTVILPKAPEHIDFVQKLKNVFQKSYTGTIEFIESDTKKKNEITLINIANLFPLRFIQPIEQLADKYIHRINSADNKRAVLEIHIESDGSQHPDLFIASTDDIIKEGIPYVILAKVLGLLEERENINTGKKVLSIITKDEDGFDNEPIDFGNNLAEVKERIDLSSLILMKNSITNMLNKKEYMHKEKQNEIIKAMNRELDAIKAEYGIDDEVYKLFLNSAKKAAKIVKSEK